jgi:hypothetical protein
MADEAGRREFLSRAPELRQAAVAELTELIGRASGLGADEKEVLRHAAANAGYVADGLHIPEIAALWGAAGESYFPAVGLPAETVRAAVTSLRRRGILRADADGVLVDLTALRAVVCAL